MPFYDSLDIANRALFHLGVRSIKSITEDSQAAELLASLYDTERPAELRRNAWRFSIRRAVLRAINPTTGLIDPVLWNALTTYMPGSIVKDANGDLWTSTLAGNLNNAPGSTTVWDEYFGPMTADVYDSTATYSTGELVYKASGNPGGFVVYRSLKDSNTDVPDTATAWAVGTVYTTDQVVTYLGVNYRSLIPYNVGIIPVTPVALWSISTTYAAAAKATGSDGFVYTSVAGSNVGNNPVTDAGVHWTNTTLANAWSNSPTLFGAATGWLALFCGLTDIVLQYPINSGGNLFRLPCGYLRQAPADPKAGSYAILGAPSGLHYDDFVFEGNYFTSSQSLILFRFAADIRVVATMDTLFCEGLAARMALGACETLTQSTGKLQNAGAMYKTFMGEARIVNGIETGPTEPPEDDYLVVRL